MRNAMMLLCVLIVGGCATPVTMLKNPKKALT
jgi:hypothetical protein